MIGKNHITLSRQKAAQRTSYNDKAMIMIGQVISHYKIIERLDEGGLVRRSQTNIRGSSDGR